MASSFGSLGKAFVDIDARTNLLEKGIKRARTQTQAATGFMAKSFSRFDAALAASETRLTNLKRSIFNLRTGAVALVAALGVRQIIRYADSWKLVEGRLKLVTSSSEELRTVQEQIFRLAQNTGQSFGDVAELYTRVARSAEQLGLTQADVLTLTEAVTKGVLASGASAAEAAGGLRQLSQGFASGLLRGEELNSVLENVPRLAIAIADGLGVSVGALRQMGSDSELTGAKVARALISQLPKLSEEAQTVGNTVERAWTRVTNATERLVGQTDSAVGATNDLADALDGLATVLEDPRFREFITGFLAEGIERIKTTIDEFVKLRDLLTSFFSGPKPDIFPIPPLPAAPSGVPAAAATPISKDLQTTIDKLKLQNKSLEDSIRLYGFYGEATDAIASKIDIENSIREEKISKQEAERIGLLGLLIAHEQYKAALEAVKTVRSALEEGQGLQLQIDARGQETEELRVQLSLLQIRQKLGEIVAAQVESEIRNTERLRSGLEQVNAERGIQDNIDEQQLLLSFASQETEEYRVQLALLKLKRDLGFEAGASLENQVRLQEKQTTAIDAQQKAQADLRTQMEAFSDALSGTATAFILGEQSFDEFAKSILRNMIAMAIQAAITAAIGAALRAVFGDATGATSGTAAAATTFGALTALLAGGAAASAHGNVFHGGRVKRFARGGVVRRPTIFPMADGGIGLMGEAGPEAILPLTRTAGGELGVQGIGGTGGITIMVDARGGGPGTEATARRGAAAGVAEAWRRDPRLRDKAGVR